MTLTDHSGNKIPRFGAAGIKRALMDPIKFTTSCKSDIYSMVWCEESEVYISRLGVGKNFELTVTYWKDNDEESEPIEEVFQASQINSAINKFIKLCKRDPLYACT